MGLTVPLTDSQAAMDIASKWRRRMRTWLTCANVAMALVLALLVGLVLERSYRSYQEQATNVADSLAAVAQLNIQSEMGKVDAVLRVTTAELERQLSGQAPGSDALLNQVLQSSREALTGVEAIRLTDANGLVRWGTGLPVGTPPNVADRDYFIQARELAQPTTLIAGPLISRVSGHWVVAFMRPLRVDGRFRGLVYVSIDVEHFTRIFERYDLESLDSVSLRHDDHRLVARFSPGSMTQGKTGDTKVSPEMLAALAAHPRGGRFVSRVLVDNEERTTSYRALDAWPFVVYAGINNQRFFAPWRNEAVSVIALATVAWLLLAAAAWLVHQAYRREKQAMQVLADQGVRIQALLREQAAMLDNDLVGMVKIRDRRISWRNRAVERMLGYGPGELQDRSVRDVYWDDEGFDRVGVEGYAALRDAGHYRSQIRMRRKSGESIWVDFSAAPLSGGELFAMLVDITAMTTAHQDLAHAACHDALTQLPNRLLLNDRIHQAMAVAKREHTGIAVCYLDLDGFKAVNDDHGHNAGDQLLCAVAERLLAGIRASDTAARLGGDEFVLVLAGLQGDEWQPVLERVIASVGEPVALDNGVTVQVSATAGVSLCPAGEQASAHDLVDRADQLMLRGKRSGKGRLFQP